MPNAKLGAKVDRYSFFVRLLPPLLHTGLARRTNISISLTELARCSFAAPEILGRERTTGYNQPRRTGAKCSSFQVCWMLVTQAQTIRGRLPLEPIRPQHHPRPRLRSRSFAQ